MPLESQSIDQIRAQITPDKVGYVLTWVPRRPGVRAFMTFLEYGYFVPDTPANAEFDVFQVPFAQLFFFLVVIPKAKSGPAEQLMRKLGLRCADGVPLVIDGQSRHLFPLNLPNIFTLEPIPGHFLYANDPAQELVACAAEDRACEKVIAEHLEKFKAGLIKP